MSRWNIAIVGGGPAGAVTAWILAGIAPRLDIVVIDAEPEPRHRPCGEYLSPAGVGVLQRCGLAEAVAATVPHPVDRVAMLASGSSARSSFAPIGAWRPPAAHGWGVRRERFDRALQEAAASRCRLIRGRRILGLEREEGGWRLRLDDGQAMRAALVVGADGRGSVVRRAAGLHRATDRRRFALVARARGIATGATVEMHLGPLGQIGICPLGDGEANLNLLLAPASAGLLRWLPREALMRAALLSTPTVRDRIRGLRMGRVMATGSLPQACTTPVALGLALVGDAAGFCDPFTGEGMSLALRQAEVLGPALAHGDLRSYAAFHAGAVARRRRIGSGLQFLLDRRRACTAALSGLARLPWLNRILVADAAGFQWA